MRLLFLLGVFLIAIVSTACAQVNRSKPVDLSFTSVHGDDVDLAKMRGKVVLIDFWATWCPPCKAEVPHLIELYNKYHAKGLEIVGISLDKSKLDLVKFTKNHDMVWPQYFDGEGWDSPVVRKFGVDQLPTMVIVGKDGRILTMDEEAALNPEKWVIKALKG